MEMLIIVVTIILIIEFHVKLSQCSLYSKHSRLGGFSLTVFAVTGNLLFILPCGQRFPP